MSKIIKLTEAQLEECRREFEASLASLKLTDGKVSFIKTLTNINEKATVYFDPLAWRKMQTLIKEFDKEVAWHGVAYRGDDSKLNEYFITDILVYPQTVTGATVETDQTKYEMWLMGHEDDVFNNIRMQGHSHVNMGVTPSSVDTTHQSKILEQLTDDMFYIFMIWNKSGNKFIKIYDMKKNILFETSDITVEILDDGSGIDEFLKEAKKLVVSRTFSTPAYNNYGYNGYSGYGGYNGYNGYNQQSQKKDTDKPSSSNIVSISTAKEDKEESTIKYGKSGKRKGNRKKKDDKSRNAGTTPVNHSSAGGAWLGDDDQW